MPGPDDADPGGRTIWARRAGAAESAVLSRSVGPVWQLPGTALGAVRAPAAAGVGGLGRWHFWWQAQLLHAAVDALDRAGGTSRARLVTAILRGIRLRNGTLWRNDYLDDVAWLALALLRAGTLAGPAGRRAVTVITARLRAAWICDDLGGLPWRRGDEFRNTPANGPAAILLARNGFPAEAQRITDWVHARLTRADGLIADGIRTGGRVEPTAYTYNQGVLLGADLALLRHGRGTPFRIHHLVEAVARGLTLSARPARPDGIDPGPAVLIGHGDGDGALFGGILARYLALVATDLPGDAAADRACRAGADRLVMDAAAAAWRNRATDTFGVWFGPDWSVAARPVGPGRRIGLTRRWLDSAVGSEPEPGTGDFSVQLGAWQLLEAAARIERHRARLRPGSGAGFAVRPTGLAHGLP